MADAHALHHQNNDVNRVFHDSVSTDRGHIASTAAFQCDACPDRFSTRSNFNKHYKHVHRWEKNIRLAFVAKSGCTICGVNSCSFSRELLKRHLLAKHGIMPAVDHQCDVCSVFFKSKYMLTSHMKREHRDVGRRS